MERTRNEVIDVDREMGTLTRFHYSPTDEDAFTIETVQRVDPIVDLNKFQYNATDERARFGDTAHVARIPLVVWEDLRKRGIADDEKKLGAWLNDPANRCFRTRPGRV